jgi:HEAT repeat protein
MSTEISVARDLARLVWLLSNEPDQVEAQKASLLGLVQAGRDRETTLELQDGRIREQGRPAAANAGEAEAELAARFALWNLAELVIARGASAADLLRTARLLAQPVASHSGIERLATFQRQSPTTVRVSGAVPLIPEPVAGGAPRTEDQLLVDAAFAAFPEAMSAPEEPEVSSHAPLLVDDHASSMFFAFASVPGKRAWSESLAELENTVAVVKLTPLLDELVGAADNALADGRTGDIADIFHGVVAREGSASSAEEKRAFAMAIRRLARPALLGAVAELLPARREAQAPLMAILARAGEDGAEAVIELLTAAQGLSERRVYFDVLVQLNSGVPALVHMLGDNRWFVVRNAVELLGELGRADAEEAVLAVVGHGDERVRSAAASALTKFGTEPAVEALRKLASDQAPAVRMGAAAGLALRGGSAAIPTLARMANDDPDPGVQAAVMLSLGRTGSREAVAFLARAAAPEGRLFNRKSLAVRLNAIQGLLEARTHEAQAALEALAHDREKQVRDAVAQASAVSAR